ncbi:hypothetical protein BT96DRAFT_980067 [Gymnopus androsaceus JB14]|uniref:F-box domain-containing protein n=1 Tax=Gymnopus androsaceus JB14 TaxID=1447944 RepID=A0A6A4H0R9_9AGAR|nr:hypothetical protein BT96DRAFT_980067 [Gymnopus androsaceus JB14]
METARFDISPNALSLSTSRNLLLSFAPELLALIFSHCNSNTITSSFTFTQVCSRWRSIAHSSPVLWTNLLIELSPTLQTEADASKYEEAITEWIMRSSTLGITLEVAEPSSSCKYYPPTTTQLDLYTNLYQNIITDFSNKWRALLLPYTQYPKDHDFVAGIAGLLEGLSLPALEELRLCVGANSSSQISLHCNAPRLYKLALNLPKILPLLACIGSYPGTISDLVLSSSPQTGLSRDFIGELLELGQLQHLTHLEIDRLTWYGPVAALPPASLPNLLKFSLCGSISGMERLLDALTLPSLRSLSLSLELFRLIGPGSERGSCVTSAPGKITFSTFEAQPDESVGRKIHGAGDYFG